MIEHMEQKKNFKTKSTLFYSSNFSFHQFDTDRSSNDSVFTCKFSSSGFLIVYRQVRTKQNWTMYDLFAIFKVRHHGTENGVILLLNLTEGIFYRHLHRVAWPQDSGRRKNFVHQFQETEIRRGILFSSSSLF